MSPSVHELQEDKEPEWLQQAEGLHYILEHSYSNTVPHLKHNPWSLKCHQQHLQRMKENAKHRNQYSILQELDAAAPLPLVCQTLLLLIITRTRSVLNVYQRLQLVPETLSSNPVFGS